MALGLTQPLVKMSTRNIPEGKGGRRVRLTILPPVMKSGSLKVLETFGPHRACYGTAFYCYYYYYQYYYYYYYYAYR